MTMNPAHESTVLAAAQAQKPELQSSHLSDLPYELLLDIAEKLPVESQVCLALTHKRLFCALSPDLLAEPLAKWTKVGFFRLLERESNVYHCLDCDKLVSYNPSVAVDSVGALHSCNRKEAAATGKPLGWKENYPESMYTFRHRWVPSFLKAVPSFSFTDAHLAMNRHRYGDHVGLPLDSLNSEIEVERWIDMKDLDNQGPHWPLAQHQVVQHEERGRRRSARLQQQAAVASGSTSSAPAAKKPPVFGPQPAMDKFVFVHTTEARIIDDELFLMKRHQTFAPSTIYEGDILNVVNRLCIPVCQHNYAYDVLWPCKKNWAGSPICRHENPFEGINNCPKNRTFASGGRHLPTSHAESIDLIPSSKVKKCGRCMTDWRVKLNHNVGVDGKSTSVEVVTWHKLGECITPMETEWRRLTDRYSDYENSFTMEGGIWRSQRKAGNIATIWEESIAGL